MEADSAVAGSWVYHRLHHTSPSDEIFRTGAYACHGTLSVPGHHDICFVGESVPQLVFKRIQYLNLIYVYVVFVLLV